MYIYINNEYILTHTDTYIHVYLRRQIWKQIRRANKICPIRRAPVGVETWCFRHPLTYSDGFRQNLKWLWSVFVIELLSRKRRNSTTTTTIIITITTTIRSSTSDFGYFTHGLSQPPHCCWRPWLKGRNRTGQNVPSMARVRARASLKARSMRSPRGHGDGMMKQRCSVCYSWCRIFIPDLGRGISEPLFNVQRWRLLARNVYILETEKIDLSCLVFQDTSRRGHNGLSTSQCPGLLTPWVGSTSADTSTGDISPYLSYL